MRHLKKGKKFGLKRGKRKAFLKNLLVNLIKKEKIITTETRAKAIKPLMEKLITRAKRQNLAALRLLIKKLSQKEAAYKVYHEIAPRYLNRRGGYLRIRKLLKRRVGDSAKQAIIEFT